MQTIIDISHYQNVNDWSALKKSADAVIVKATQGHALSSGAYLFTDRAFHGYAKECMRYGIPFGAYHFFTASNETEARREADYFADEISPYKSKLIYAACDAENYGNKWLLGLSRDELSRLITVFCKRLEKHGYFPIHYTNTDHINSFIRLESIPYPVWQAHYGKTKPSEAGDRLLAWQYTDKGRVGGISGNVDMSRGYISEAELAIMKLGAIGVIDSPYYWRKNYTKTKYLDLLLIRAQREIKRASSPCPELEAALKRLSERGIVDTPEYWLKAVQSVEHLSDLIKKLGGSI